MTTPETVARYFIAVSADPSNRLHIDEIGHTAEEAIAAAVKAAGLPENKLENGGYFRDAYGDIVEDAFVSQECTKALYELVEAKGGAVSWDDSGRLADVIDEAA